MKYKGSWSNHHSSGENSHSSLPNYFHYRKCWHQTPWLTLCWNALHANFVKSFLELKFVMFTFKKKKSYSICLRSLTCTQVNYKSIWIAACLVAPENRMSLCPNSVFYKMSIEHQHNALCFTNTSMKTESAWFPDISVLCSTVIVWSTEVKL